MSVGRPTKDEPRWSKEVTLKVEQDPGSRLYMWQGLGRATAEYETPDGTKEAKVEFGVPIGGSKFIVSVPGGGWVSVDLEPVLRAVMDGLIDALTDKTHDPLMYLKDRA